MNEAPPWTPPRRTHGITSIKGHHHKLSLQELWNYILLTLCTRFTNQSESSLNTNIMHKQQFIHLMLLGSYNKQPYQWAIHTEHKTCPNLAQTRDPLAQASSSSPRRELEPLNNGHYGFSLRRVHPHLGEITPRSKINFSRLGDSLHVKAWASSVSLA